MDHLDTLVRWMDEPGTDTDVVLSTRVRLARNLKDLPFSTRLSDTGKKKVLDTVTQAVTDTTEPCFRTLTYEAMERLETDQRERLVQKYLISRELMRESYGGTLINDRETLSVMINEEDHLRIQSLRSGLGLTAAYEQAENMDSLLHDRLPIAYHERFGYLTTCPTNVGSGMRASVMLHLPGYAATHRVGAMVEEILKLGFVVRGVYGEGTEAGGNLFQVSNQVTLGDSEENVLRKLDAVVQQIIREERTLEKALQNADPAAMEDRCFRALGLLRESRLMSEKEAMQRLSQVWLGVNLGLIPDFKPEDLARQMIAVRPQLLEGNKKDQKEEDILRAKHLRGAFAAR